MKFVLRATLLVLVALPVVALALVALCFQDQPLVTRTAQLTPQDIERAKRILDAQGARRAGPDGLRALALSQRDVNVTLSYLANQLAHGAARAELRQGHARVQASFELPRSPIGRFVNIDAGVREAGAVPRFDHLKIGRVPVPAALANYVLDEAMQRTQATDRGQIAADVVKAVRIREGWLAVTYRWTDEVAARARAAMVSAEDQARLRAYQERLADAVANASQPVSLAALLPPVFELALDRGAAGDMVRENRAALVALAFYVNGKGLTEVVAPAETWRQPARRTVTLAGRDDFPKHYLVSAAIAAAAGSPLADAIGVYKEIDDARRGSGFSFNDIAADRAGTRLGEVASQSPDRARKLARALVAGVNERDFMPDVADLPEFLPEAQFERRFGGVGGPGYEEMMAKIEARVAALPVLQ